MKELSVQAVDLLRAAVAVGNLITWESARARMKMSTVELNYVVRELLEHGLVVSADSTVMKPPLRVTAKGNAQLNQLQRRLPKSILQLAVTSGLDPRSDSMRLILREGLDELAEARVDVSSYLLAAIRYLLVLAPGGLSANIVSTAALRIGTALLPPCERCSKELPPPCASCVRGIVEERMRTVGTSGDWIRIDLLIDPPWTYVPWEMAALRATAIVALDPRLALVRRLSDDERCGHLDGDVSVLLVAPAVKSEKDAEALAGEMATISAVITEQCSSNPRLTVDTVEGIRDVSELAGAVLARRPRCIHVLGHGSPDGLVAGKTTITKPDAAAALAQDWVDVVVLSSCFGATSFGTNTRGASLAWQIAEKGVASVVAFEGQAEASNTTMFSVAFYQMLRMSGSVEEAVRAGRAAMLSGSPYYQSGQVVLFGR